MERTSIKKILKKMEEMAKLRKFKEFQDLSNQILDQMLFEDVFNYSSKRELITTINKIFIFFGNYEGVGWILDKLLEKEQGKTKSNGDFTAFILNLLGELYYYKGEYEPAIKNYQQSLDLRLSLLGDSHPDTLESYINLSLLNTELGRFSEAEVNYTRVLKIYESEISGHMEEYLIILLNNGLLYQYWGKYSKAIEKYLTALEISQLNGTEEITDNLENNLGVLYLETGNNEVAERYLLKSARYTQEHYGLNHPKTITTLNNLVSAQMNLGKLAVSEEGFSKLLETEKKDMPITTLKIKINFATLLIRKKKLEKALKILNEVVQTPVVPEIHVKALSNIAKIHQSQKEYQKAVEYLERALEVQDKTTGKKHIQYTKLLGMKANAYVVLSEKQRAFKTLQEATQIQNDILLEVSTAFSRDYAWNFLQKINGELNKLISLFYLLQKERPKEDQFLNIFMVTVYEQILGRKAVVFETGIERYKNILNDRDPHLKKLFETLIKMKEEIVLRTTKGFFKETPEENKIKIKALNEKAEVIENRISSTVPIYSLQGKTKRATLKLLKDKMPVDTVFLDIFKFRFFDFVATEEQWQGFGYILFYLSKDEMNHLIIDDAEEIEKMIKESDSSNTDLNRGLNSQTNEKKGLCPDQNLQGLWNILFKDNSAFSNSSIQNICLSTDGEFNNLPFETLIDENGKYLIEKYSIHYVSSGRSLISINEKLPGDTEKILLFANPSFDLKQSPKTDCKSISQRSERQIFRNELDQFPELPGTSSEANEIFKVLSKKGIQNIYIYSRESVNDSVLKQIKSPQILHLATHGFYLENKVNIHPYARCGIALSGINNILRGEDIPQLFEDGILTATDILALNLNNTQIVVLSACKTGRGEIKPGDGIIGLSSALISTGVSSVLMSLWNVPDVFTVTLMGSFYQYLSMGFKKSVALKKAKIKLINSLRSQWGEAPSWIWGGFVLYGDDSPISDMTKSDILPTKIGEKN